MSRIGITQRVEEVSEYEERRDCLDQRWGPLLYKLGYLPIPLFNRIDTVEEYLSALELDGIILTGGNDLASVSRPENIAPERDAFEEEVLKFAVRRDVPVIGVCRGAQLINRYFGGSISSITDHVATKHRVNLDDPPIGVAAAEVTTNSYHGYGITDDDLANHLRVVGRVDDDTIEWIEHPEYPISAIMWHPERDSPSAELDRRIIAFRLERDDA